MKSQRNPALAPLSLHYDKKETLKSGGFMTKVEQKM